MTTKTNLPLLRISILLISSLISCNVFATQALPEFSAKYAVKKFGIKLAEAHYQLHYTKTGYKITQNTDLYGIALLFSDYALTAVSYVEENKDNLLLRKHIYILSGSDEDEDEYIDILWRRPKDTLSGAITGVVRGQEINAKSDAEVWDLLSFQIPLMIEASENIKEYPYNAILRGEINSYSFELREVKKVTFANKEYNALRLVCPDPHRDRELHIWLLPELHNIPVLIENYREGRVHYSGKLESVQFNDDEPIRDQITENMENNDDDF